MNIPAGTVIYAATGTFSSIPVPTVDTNFTTSSSLSAGGYTYNPIGSVIEFGIPNVSLIFDQLVTVTIPNITETPAKVIYSVDGTTWYAISQCDASDITAVTPDPSFPGACFGYNATTDIITLKTYHFTKFAGAGISAPTVTSGSASSISRSGATLSGEITSIGGENATARGFEYGETTSYGSTYSSSGTFSTGVFSTSLTGLSCGTTYHFRAFATNSGGTGYGSDATFTTDSCGGAVGGGGGAADVNPPSISNITVTVADTYATISWQTSKASLTWLLYGTTTSYGLEKKTTSYLTSHSVSLSGLTPETTYHYQIKSKDSSGNIGSYTDKTFTTLALGEEPKEVVEEVVTKPITEMTVEELRAEITRIMALIKQLQAELFKLKGCTITSFERNLKLGMSGDDVKCLQIILNSDIATRLAVSGVGSSGNETNYFGPLTQAAVIKFQEKYATEILASWGLTKGTGFVGSTTRAKLNQFLGK